MQGIAGWLAPAATMIAAMMTAANLGARVTGWGFVVFTLGSIAWTIVGLASGQTNLVASNAFLTVVNLVGIWRWLGRQRIYEDGGRSAKRASRRPGTPTLFAAGGIGTMAVHDRTSARIGTLVDALLECATGRVSHVVVATGGVGGVAERLRAIDAATVRFGCDRVDLRLDRAAVMALPALTDGDWPDRADRAA